jgi:hypothetical protein
MAGGPINGVPLLGALNNLNPFLNMTDRYQGKTAIDDINKAIPQAFGVIIPTVLQIAEDAISYWTSMTCLYDKYHVVDQDRATLPFCLFHVTEITPIFAVETSKERIILYEPSGDEHLTAKEMSNQLRENVIRVVVDNSVKQPTIYQVEAIVPFQPLGRYVKQGVKTMTDMVTTIGEMFHEIAGDVLGSIFAPAIATVGMIDKFTDTMNKLQSMDGSAMINVNSLEAMASSCRVLCMKMWTGYDYKFVQMTNMTYKKRGTEDDVVRATFTLQEKPILAVSKPSNMTKKPPKEAWAVSGVVGKTLTEPLVDFLKVKKAVDGSL